MNTHRIEAQLTGIRDNTARNRVRAEILAVANRNSDRTFRMKNIREAVNLVRSRHLVSDSTLLAAGYNPTGRKR